MRRVANPDATPLKLLVAGGGTGGHVFPALAVAKEWLSRGANREAIFVGTARGLENRLVPEAGIALEHIRSAGLKGMGGMKLVKNLAMLPGAFFDSLAILRRHEFSAAFGVGRLCCRSRDHDRRVEKNSGGDFRAECRTWFYQSRSRARFDARRYRLR